MKKRLKNFVNGQFVDGGRLFDNINPVNGELVNEVMEADAATVDAAVAAARAALAGPWGQMNAGTAQTPRPGDHQLHGLRQLLWKAGRIAASRMPDQSDLDRREV